MRTFLILLVSSIVGLILGFGIGAISEAALFTSAWEELPETPSRAVDLHNHGNEVFHVQTEDGNSWNYSPSKGWVEATAEEQPFSSRPNEIVDPCDQSSPEFSFPFRSPENIKDCVQVTEMFADGYTAHTIVLDEQGRIWSWQKTGSGYSALAQKICCPGIGAILGTIVGVIIIVSKKRRLSKQ